jgi:hypothetical protein
MFNLLSFYTIFFQILILLKIYCEITISAALKGHEHEISRFFYPFNFFHNIFLHIFDIFFQFILWLRKETCFFAPSFLARSVLGTIMACHGVNICPFLAWSESLWNYSWRFNIYFEEEVIIIIRPKIKLVKKEAQCLLICVRFHGAVYTSLRTDSRQEGISIPGLMTWSEFTVRRKSLRKASWCGISLRARFPSLERNSAPSLFTVSEFLRHVSLCSI